MTADHFHAYAHVSGTDYRAACCATWLGAVVHLRNHGVRNAVPGEATDQLIGPGEPPWYVIQREAGSFDACDPGA